MYAFTLPFWVLSALGLVIVCTTSTKWSMARQGFQAGEIKVLGLLEPLAGGSLASCLPHVPLKFCSGSVVPSRCTASPDFIGRFCFRLADGPGDGALALKKDV